MEYVLSLEYKVRYQRVISLEQRGQYTKPITDLPEAMVYLLSHMFAISFNVTCSSIRLIITIKNLRSCERIHSSWTCIRR